jgi:hypothetical protein
VLSESFPSDYFGPRFMHTDRAVVAGRTKLVARGAGGWELYDLSRDPGELDNRYARDAAAAAPLAEHLRKWLEGKPARGDRFTLDEETLRRLRSLGYMQ